MNTNNDYNNAPMMYLNDYNEIEGIDLNIVDSETLDILYTTQQVIWVTEIHLDENNEIVDVFKSINEKIFANNKENSRLSLLRDTLLPRLMSGEIEIPE